MQGGQGWKWRSKSRRRALLLSLLLHLLAFFGLLLMPSPLQAVPTDPFTVVLSPLVPQAEAREASRPPQPAPVRARSEPGRPLPQTVPKPTPRAEGSAPPAPSPPRAGEGSGVALGKGTTGAPPRVTEKPLSPPPSQPEGPSSRKPGEPGGETASPAPEAGGSQGPKEGFPPSTGAPPSGPEGLPLRRPTEPGREDAVPPQGGRPLVERESAPGPMGIGGGQEGGRGEAMGRGWASPGGTGLKEEGGPVLGPGVGSPMGGQAQEAPMGPGPGAGKEHAAGTGAGVSREALGPGSGPGVGGESGRCAVVVELRGLPYAQGPSPAILDPEGRQVWPEPGRVQGVPSEVVDRSGIALFFRPGEFREEGFSRVYRVRALSTRARGPQNRFPELVVVSREEAEKVRLAPSTCQLVFIR